MSTATVIEFGANWRAFLAAVQVGETVAITDKGKEVARLVPGAQARPATAPVTLSPWAQQRLAELEETFPEPILGLDEIMEDSRADISER